MNRLARLFLFLAFLVPASSPALRAQAAAAADVD